MSPTTTSFVGVRRATRLRESEGGWGAGPRGRGDMERIVEGFFLVPFVVVDIRGGGGEVEPFVEFGGEGGKYVSDSG